MKYQYLNEQLSKKFWRILTDANYELNMKTWDILKQLRDSHKLGGLYGTEILLVTIYYPLQHSVGYCIILIMLVMKCFVV